jgi:uncharacterized protein
VHGNLLTLPVGNSFLYVEPLYVQAVQGRGSYPTLQRVLVVYGDSIGYGATLANALSDLEPDHSTGQTLPGGSTAGSGNGGQTPTPTPTPPAPTSTNSPPTTAPVGRDAMLTQLNDAFTQLQDAYKTGDFTAIGAAQGNVQKLLQAYIAKYGALPSGSKPPTTTPTPSK